MRRLTVLLFLFVAAPAQAAPLNELPFTPRSGVATCLRAPGTPGGMALFAPRSTDLLAGTARTARVRLGPLTDCAAVATAGGAAVVAGPVEGGRGGAHVLAVVRDAGGGFGAAVPLGGADRFAPSVAAAIAPGGDTVVAWLQRRGKRHRVVAVRRRPGAPFGAVEPLTPWRSKGEFSADGNVAAAMSAAGEATIAWALPTRDREPDSGRSWLATAHAVPGGPFAFQSLLQGAEEVSRVALAVAPDGWAVLAYDEVNGLHAFQRAPGVDRFAPAFTQPDFASEAPAVAVRDGGGGMVAWRTGFGDGGVMAATRPAAGAFPAPRRVAPDREQSFGAAEAILVQIGGPPVDARNGALRGALAPDGTALLAWTARRAGVDRPTVASGTLAGGFARPATLGSPIRDANGVAPLFLADGRSALAWTDNVTEAGLFPRGHGRLHLAVAGAPPAAEPALPRVTLTAPRRRRLFAGQALRVRVGCDRACDLRVGITGSGESAESRSLGRARTVTVGLSSFADRPGPSRRRVKVRVRATGPGGHEVVSVTRRVLIIGRPPQPVPKLLDLAAVRDGRTIVVSWRTSFPARQARFVVLGLRTRRPSSVARSAARLVEGRGRSRFRVRLRPDRPAKVRFVQLYATTLGSETVRVKLVPVR